MFFIWEKLSARIFHIYCHVVFGYYNEFTFVLTWKRYKWIYKDHSVNCCIYHTIDRHSMLMTQNVFSYVRFNLNCTDALFFESKINSRGVTPPRQKHGRKVSFKDTKRICTTVISHVNISKSYDPNTYNIDNIIENPNVPSINVHTKCS